MRKLFLPCSYSGGFMGDHFLKIFFVPAYKQRLISHNFLLTFKNLSGELSGT